MLKLLNPLKNDFSITYDVNENDKPVTFTLLANKITTFDNERIFNHTRKHLITAILNERNIIQYDAQRDKISKEITK